MSTKRPNKKGTKEDKYKVISLFSGAMGLDIGLESTGRFEILAAVEKEHVFCETIRENQKAGRLSKKLKIYEADITTLDPSSILNDIGIKPGDIDLIVGGPPCQSFSTAGKRGTVNDPRGTLIWQYLRFVTEMKPKFFLMENVRGLLSAALNHRPIAERPEKGGSPLQDDEKPGSVVRLFANDMQNINETKYHMDVFEVNAVNYGAPQIRERVLFIGNRYGMVVDFPEPTYGTPNKKGGQTDIVHDFSEKLLPWKTLGDAIEGLCEDHPEMMDFSPRKKKYLAMVPPGSNWRSLPIEMQKESMGSAWEAKGGRSGWWRRLSFDLPCPTLITMPNHAGTSLCHPKDVRALTIREYARIQEFPDDWVFCGTLQQKYTQVGNAVPVRLGKVAGTTIAQNLDLLRSRNWEPNAKDAGDYRVIYVQSHIRTRQWYKNGETFVWEEGKDNAAANYSAPKTKHKSRSLTR